MDDKVKEAIRYLGYGKNAVDNRTYQQILTSFSELQRTADLRFVCRLFDFTQISDSKIRLGTVELESKHLAKNLRGCEKVYVFGATLGIDVDRMLRRKSVSDMAEAVILQACAAALLEEYCDEIQQKLAKEQEKKGMYLRPRFSPGYGDFSLNYQVELTRMLDCAKTIGLTVTESMMMSPTKSVTALIGISREKIKCHRHGCEACEKTDCNFRR